MGVGHVRYPTAGSSSVSEAQPFYVNSPYGIVLAHNGNITNSTELSRFVDSEAHRHINTNSDSELLLNIFAHELQTTNKFRIDYNDIFKAIVSLNRRVRGGYAVAAMLAGYGIIAFRDPYGIRPLVYGKRKSENGGVDWAFASESVALTALGFELVADVKPGEALVVTMDGQMHQEPCSETAVLSPCIFEYVYFARPDSVMDGVSVYQSRLAMGEALAKKIMRDWPDNDIDVVIPVPDTSRVSALQLSHVLGKLYREGFIKNRYVGRTFIMPGQTLRRKSVRRKLNAMPQEFNGKNVLLVDDSIVRGTTSQEIIAMAREAGAKKVYIASCAPAIRYPNVYGIDMPAADELVAYRRTEKEVAGVIGADVVIYQDLEDLKHSVRQCNPALKQFEASVFDGVYPTGDIDQFYLASLAANRNDSAKEAREAKTDFVRMVGLHNYDSAPPSPKL
eukprot:Colp12_sorted_trinity150504_noHs@29069